MSLKKPMNQPQDDEIFQIVYDFVGKQIEYTVNRMPVDILDTFKFYESEEDLKKAIKVYVIANIVGLFLSEQIIFKQKEK